MMDLRFLRLLSEDYPTIQTAAAEAVRLSAVLSLPKGTEFYFSDLHGEHEAFIHLLRSASGFIRRKIDDLLSRSVSEAERIALSNLIYYPERELNRLSLPEREKLDWFRVTVHRLLAVSNSVSAKYTRRQVRKKLPDHFAPIIDELLHVTSDSKEPFYEACMQEIMTTGMMNDFLISLCQMIQKLAIDKLHIIGDVFDRGPRADAIMNALIDFHDVDLQWGNHDILWMGAAAGSQACVANVIRQGIGYNNFDLLEDGYNINLRPLATFAAQTYQDDPCTLYTPRVYDQNKYDPIDSQLAARMNKAITIIQFKLENQLVARHPEFAMDDRLLLRQIDFSKGVLKHAAGHLPLKDTHFPTIDPADPTALSDGEEALIKTITTSFRHSERLQKHIRFLYTHGSMYKAINGNLLYHGCIPMTDNGEFARVPVAGRQLSGKACMDAIDQAVRQAHLLPPHTQAQYEARDYLWYLWCGPLSPLFGKDRMATFERLLLEDKSTHKETMNPYYQRLDDPAACAAILADFGLDPQHDHIVNGHVPVKLKAGESPVKAGGRLFVIDGGISKAYQKQTGIGGYTLVYNSRYLALAEHAPFHVDEQDRPVDMSPRLQVVETKPRRMAVADTDEGQTIRERITALNELVEAYRQGKLKETL